MFQAPPGAPKAKQPGQGDPVGCCWHAAGSPQASCPPPAQTEPPPPGGLPRGRAHPLKGDRCWWRVQRRPICVQGAATSHTHTLPLPLLAHPPAPILAPLGAPFSRGVSGPPRALRAAIGGQGEAVCVWGGAGLASLPPWFHLRHRKGGRGSPILPSPPSAPPGHPSGPPPAVGGAVTGVAPPPGNAGGSKNRKYSEDAILFFLFKWGGGIFVPPQPPLPHPVSSKRGWQWHPGLAPSAPPRPRGRGLWLLACGWVMLSPAAGRNRPDRLPGGASREEMGGAARWGLKSHFLRVAFPPSALQLPRGLPSPDNPPLSPPAPGWGGGALLNPGRG